MPYNYRSIRDCREIDRQFQWFSWEDKIQMLKDGKLNKRIRNYTFEDLIYHVCRQAVRVDDIKNEYASICNENEKLITRNNELLEQCDGFKNKNEKLIKQIEKLQREVKYLKLIKQRRMSWWKWICSLFGYDNQDPIVHEYEIAKTQQDNELISLFENYVNKHSCSDSNKIKTIY